MNLLCFLGAVGLSVASGSAALPSYSVLPAGKPVRSLYSFAQAGNQVFNQSPVTRYIMECEDDDSVAWYFGFLWYPSRFPGVIDVCWVVEPSTNILRSTDLSSPNLQLNYRFSDSYWYPAEAGSSMWDSHKVEGVAFRDEPTDWEFAYTEMDRHYGTFYNSHPWESSWNEPIALSSSTWSYGADYEFQSSGSFCRARTDSISCPSDVRAAFATAYPNGLDALHTFTEAESVVNALDAVFDYVQDPVVDLLKEVYLYGSRVSDEEGAYWDGFDDGKDEGLTEGYQAGLRDGADGVTPYEVVNFYDVFSMIISTPLTFLYTSLDVEIFSGTPYAFNPGTFVVSILIVLMIWRIVVMVIGIKNGG